MVKVMYNDKLVYEVVIWVFLGISLWKEKEALTIINREYRKVASNNYQMGGGRLFGETVKSIPMKVIILSILYD